MQRSMRTNATAVTHGVRELRVLIPGVNIRLHSHPVLVYLPEYCAKKHVICQVCHTLFLSEHVDCMC